MKYQSKKLSKIYIIVAAMLLLSVVLAACGYDSTATVVPPTTTAAPTTAATPATTAAAVTTAAATVALTTAATTSVAVVDDKLKVDLTFAVDLPTEAQQVFRDQIQRFTKMYPNVKINGNALSGDELLYQVENGVSTNKGPDLIVAPSDFVADLTALKAIQPADKVFDKAGLDGYVTNALAGSNVGGTQWGIPLTYSGAAVMLYNKKMISTPPTTVEEMVSKAKDIDSSNTTKGPLKDRTIGLFLDINEPYIFAAWVGGYGGTLLDSNNQPTLNTPAVVNALKFTQDLVVKDKLINPSFEPTNNQMEYAFRDGRLAMMITGDWEVQKYASAATGKTAAKVTEDKLDLGVAPLPSMAGKQAVPLNNGSTLYIGANTSGDNLKATKLFVDYIAQLPQQNEFLTKSKILPATKAIIASSTVTDDPIWSGLVKALELSKPQPNAIQMRAVWDAIRPNLEAVAADTMKPDAAAKQMQQDAQDKIKLLEVK
jgi:maltose-binding protein MalE